MAGDPAVTLVTDLRTDDALVVGDRAVIREFREAVDHVATRVIAHRIAIPVAGDRVAIRVATRVIVHCTINPIVGVHVVCLAEVRTAVGLPDLPVAATTGTTVGKVTAIKRYVQTQFAKRCAALSHLLCRHRCHLPRHRQVIASLLTLLCHD